eukprot:CAMPEP_0181433456 /NCGR_PEP_ID=MMETSP1110-20121109/19301_1 /TAXON_ID=174948 /ORGANISM="Symbiodinium sp., Strain CCMP421" /LENGTH=1044 /DNA_ID=CAMNT_0023556909 /DNA_START=133 /DNA_END=3267 /DNA_ORIENTATION=+
MASEHEIDVPEEGSSALPPTTTVQINNEDTDMADLPAEFSTKGFERQTSGMEEAGFVARMPSDELARQAKEFSQSVKKKMSAPSQKKHGVSEGESKKSKKSLLVESVLGAGDKHDHKAHKHKKGAFAGVFVPTCENMWGVLIFLRFYFVVGQAGIGQALLCVLISFCAAFCTTSSMSAIVSSGGLVSKGGPYYMISRALGPSVGASVGIMYWLAITLLAVLETLGAVEALLMAAPSLNFPGCKQAFGSGFMAVLILAVWGGTSFVTRLGIFFVLIVFYTMASYYAGIISAPLTDIAKANPWVTGLSWDTFQKNWGPHYDDQTNFGVVLSVFFPCFTGILSGANRADILKDPPRNIKDGTFGAIIFSFFMYSSFFILWGCVADYRYLQGQEYHADGDDHSHRRLAGAGAGDHLVEEIVWNPFPHSAQIGIIISSLSQALQCLIVAPRLLQSIARDKILSIFDKIAPLSSRGEPVRALFATYAFAAMLVLIGEVNAVAPLLTMCFLVAYSFMNFSCFILTWVRSPGFRPTGMSRRRWRIWYMSTGLIGSIVCLSIMAIVSELWALAVLAFSFGLYLYINWKLEQAEWGSALDGMRYQLALNSLIQLESSGHHAVNWRPQVLILYRIHLSEELKGIKHHEILRFYSHLRKGNGFAVVACVLESDKRDEHSLHKANIERDIIKSIMKEEQIQGFAECVVAPSWSEGCSYIIQLSGIGGLAPNTVLVDWPMKWRKQPIKAKEFVTVLSTALAAEKSVLAVKGLEDMPLSAVVGTIDVWWMIHDGGFMILLSWLLLQHRIWRQCHIRIFTITEGVSEERAKNAAKLLTETLRQRRLFDVDVEVVLVDDEMIQPYTYDWTLRVEQRHKFVEQLHGVKSMNVDAIPLEIDDLFKMEEEAEAGSVSGTVSPTQPTVPNSEGHAGSVAVCDLRSAVESERAASHSAVFKGESFKSLGTNVSEGANICGREPTKERPALATEQKEWDRVASFVKLNEMITSRSKRSQLVVMNLPDVWSTEDQEVNHFMTYCDTMTKGLDRVLFVHSSGHEVFEIG